MSLSSSIPPTIIPGAEPFLFPGNDIGVLLSHGFTGVPREMRAMGAYLNQQGYTCLGIRLSGHATRVEDLDHCTWQNWYTDVLDGISLLRSNSKHIFLAGLSLGGILTLFTASQVHDLAGVIAMSTPFVVRTDWKLKYIHLFKHFVKRIEKGTPDWEDKEALSHHLEYPYMPVAGVVQVNELSLQMRTGLSQITSPVCLMHSRGDKGVPFESMAQIYQAIGNKNNEQVTIERGSHTMTCDCERQTVFTAAHAFIQKVISQ
ncbi:MAG: alpha/beta fold hydrolase [Anaerolineaceae bacterium]